MTALAQVLQARGVRVSGSDIATHFFTEEVLHAANISFVEGFAAAHLPVDVDLVIVSTAYGNDHVEIVAARARSIPVLTYPEAVAMLFNAGRGIAVCGTHGKTTTTAMLGLVLAATGYDPTVIVGSAVPQFGGNARVGKSNLIVLEADEYQNKLQHYQPHGVVLTAIEYDHPDFFPTFASYVDAFRAFVRRIPPEGFLVACVDDPTVREVMGEARCLVIPYGLSAHAAVPTQQSVFGREALGATTLRVPGEHNIQNALGALAAAETLGASRDAACAALATFQGTKRRFEVLGEWSGVVVVDDYAHHPTEIRVTLAAARDRYGDRSLRCVFQPHTFTRTIALRDAFVHAFPGVTKVYLMDIYGSTREQHGGITAAELAGEISAGGTPATAIGGVAATVRAVLADVQPGDVVLCLGAGENDQVARGLAEALV